MDGPSHLGPFALAQVLGRGAMGDVWLAHHRTTGTPVAIKVLSTNVRLEPLFVDAFLRESELVAGLSHPNVVGVYDVGLVPEGTGLPVGVPFLAMEAAAGTVADAGATLTWPAIARVLAATLAALAHAHARGVVHRDVKPANLLVGAPLHRPDAMDPGGGLRLADFGVAVGAAGSGAPSGTPAYMAPEQADPAAPIGPWTDLYGVGATAWQLVTGHVPFRGDTAWSTLDQAARAPLPPFRPHTPVPEDLEQWVRTLLAKAPAGRPARAADALAALERLSERLIPAAVDAVASAPTRPLTDDDATATFVVVSTAPVPADPQPEPVACPWPPPPLPTGWRRRERDVEPPLPGTGLGVLALREPPWVGRTAERDALWRVLSDWLSTGDQRRVDLVGPVGSGRSRLADWLASRAHEAGAVEAFRVSGDLADAVAAWAGGAEHVAALARLHGVEAWVADGLASWVVAGGPAPLPLLAGLFERLASHRPLVVTVTTADAAARSGVEALVSRVEGPLLVVWTDDAPSAAPSVPVPVLAAEEMDALLRDTLALEATVADAVALRAGGLPGVALQLLQAQAAVGVLVPGPGGFQLTDGAALVLDDDTNRRWLARVDAVSDPLGLERLAVLGEPVPVDEVPAATDAVRAGLLAVRGGRASLCHPALRLALVERARDAGRLAAHRRWAAARAASPVERAGHRLATGDREAVGVLVAAGRASIAEGRPRESLRVAELLDGVPDLSAVDRRAVVQIRVHGLLHRGAPADAVPLLRALLADERDPVERIRLQSSLGNTLRLAGEIRAAVAALAEAAAALAALPDAPLDVRRHVAMNRAVLALRTGASDIHDRIDDAVRLAAAEDPPTHVGDAHTLRAWLSFEAGQLDIAVEAMERACGATHRSAVGRADRLQDLAFFLTVVGRLDEARDAIERSLVLARQAGSARSVAGACARMAGVHQAAGETAAALLAIEQALAWTRRQGNLAGTWQVHRARMLGRLGRRDEARAVLDAVRASEDGPSLHVPLLAEAALLDAHDQPEPVVLERLAMLEDGAAKAGMADHPILLDVLRQVDSVCADRGLDGAAAHARGMANPSSRS